MSAVPVKLRRVVVVGALGSIGQMVGRQLLDSGIAVTGIDLVSSEGGLSTLPFPVVRGDVLNPDEQVKALLGEADMVCLALSYEVLSRCLKPLCAHLAPHCLIVETLSIKSKCAELIREQAVGHQVVGINPMFSGDLDPAGRPLVLVHYAADTRRSELRELLRHWNLNVFEMTAHEHDRYMAQLQTANHFLVLVFGQVLCRADVNVSQLLALAPPPFRVMYALLARMTHNHPDVYWEIQSHNPFSSQARVWAGEALQALGETIDADQRERFHAVMGELRNTLIAPAPETVSLCRHLFERVNEQPAGIEQGLSLGDFRARIDRIDDQLIDLLGRRLDIVRQVAQRKKGGEVAVMQPERVRQVIERCTQRGEQRSVPAALVEQLYQQIIEQACQIEYDIVGGPRESLDLTALKA
jgi:prephenate dehydrogenase